MWVGLMCTLGPSIHKATPRCALFAIAKECNHTLTQKFSFQDVTYWVLLTHPKIISSLSLLSPFNSSFILLAIWALGNESICIERTGGCETPASVWIVALRAWEKGGGGESKVRTIQTAGGAGIWADIKRWLCVGFYCCAPEKECKPCISQSEDNKQ